jgi:cytochrome P450
MTVSEPIDLACMAHKASAHKIYAALRLQKPVCRIKLPGGQTGWLLTRYDDVSKLLKDDRFVKDPANALTAPELAKLPKIPSFLAPLTRNMLGMDDPDHARLKKLVQAGFTPRRMDMLVSRTEDIAERLIAGFKGKAQFDLIGDFALPLPVTVISEMLGVPEADRSKFARWSQVLLNAPAASWRIAFALPSMLLFVRYLRTLIAMKRKKPADDLVSALVAHEADGQQLNGEELQAMIAILLSAGHETTTNLIGNGTLALLKTPQAMEQLASAPALAGNAVEELLRYDGPVEASTFRYARSNLDIAGQPIARGDVVLGSIASANRDDTQFIHPDQLDFHRSTNRHLTFGEGGHYCVGAALARMEGRVSFNALLRHFPGLRLAMDDSELRWRPNAILRGITRLIVAPVAFHAAARRT